MSQLPRLLVTGHHGFVGQTLQQYWAESAWSQQYQWVVPDQPYDLRDASAVSAMVARARPDAVLHLAAQSFVPASFADPLDTLRINLHGTLHLLQSLREHAFSGRFLFVSSADVYGAVEPEALPVDERRLPVPRNPYAVSKLAAEHLCRQVQITEGLDIVIARPFNHVGVGQAPRFVLSGFAQQIARMRLGKMERRLQTGNLRVTRDFCDVTDVLDAYLALLRDGRSGEIYNVCAGQERSLEALLTQMLDLADMAAEVVTDAALLRPNEQQRMCGDHRRLTEHTGWRPRRPLESTLRSMLTWWLHKENETP